MVSPLVIAVPVAGGLLAYLLWPKSSDSSLYQPPPGPKATGPGGPRAQSYQSQVSDALNAYLIAWGAGSVFGSQSAIDAAKKQLLGTADVVAGMSAADLKLGVITAQDKAAIDAQIAAAKKQAA